VDRVLVARPTRRGYFPDVAAAELDRKVLYELDGGDRAKKRTFQVTVQPDAVTVCVPAGKA
jgi:hypothetical protein